MANNGALLRRIELMEKEIAQIRETLSQPPPDPPTSIKGLWKDIEVTDEDLEEVTHPERVIERLKAENEALRRELFVLRGSLSKPEL